MNTALADFSESLHLLPFQREAVNRMKEVLKKNEAHAVYNACEPGLGKTIQAAFCCKEMGFQRLFIVCPAIMRLPWKYELMRCGYKESEICAVLTKRDLDKAVSASIVIISYDLLSRGDVYRMFGGVHFDCLIGDEIHYTKGIKSLRTQVFYTKIWPSIKYKIVLSGTPFTSCVTDCWTAFSRCLPGYFGSWFDFAEKFSNYKYTPWGPKYEGIKDAKLLSEIIRKHFFIRYKKKDVLSELPNKVYTNIGLSSSYAIAEYERSLKKLLDEGVDITQMPTIPSHLMSLISLQGELKVNPISEYAKDLLDQEIPIVLFGRHRKVIQKYAENLHSYKPSIITGDTSAVERERAISDFQEGRTNLLIGNIDACGVGVTLTRAEYVLLAELPWTPAQVIQAVDRAHRIGQKKSLQVVTFSVDKSYDGLITSTILKKSKAFKELFG